MKKTNVLIAFVVGCITSYIALELTGSRSVVTTTLRSPDGNFVAVLQEHDRLIDRNFSVLLVDKNDEAKLIFQSPDEGRPVGTERFLWSCDSQHFVLLGRNFLSVANDAILSNGESVYLLYSLHDENLWSNSMQVDLPRVAPSDLHELDFSCGGGMAEVIKRSNRSGLNGT